MTAHENPVLNSPAKAAAASCGSRRGKGIRSAKEKAVRMTDTRSARSNAKTNGGTAAMPTLIADQVSPQIATRQR